MGYSEQVPSILHVHNTTMLLSLNLIGHFFTLQELSSIVANMYIHSSPPIGIYCPFENVLFPTYLIFSLSVKAASALTMGSENMVTWVNYIYPS